MATISEVARHLGVDRDTVSTWTTEFAQHLSLKANPPKGTERQFGENDLRVMALVAYFWEDDPDLEHIHTMLNSGDYNEDEFAEFACMHTPVFQNVPDEIDETWRHGVLIGGMASREWVQIARSYKRAADSLVAEALKSDEPHEYDYPIFYLYRHCLELYLKTILDGTVRGHDFAKLIKALEEKYKKTLGGWIRERLWDFHEIDQKSDVFRYPEDVKNGELWIDFHHLQAVMEKMTSAFERHLLEKNPSVF